jgi:hypothetical protein
VPTNSITVRFPYPVASAAYIPPGVGAAAQPIAPVRDTFNEVLVVPLVVTRNDTSGKLEAGTFEYRMSESIGPAPAVLKISSQCNFVFPPAGSVDKMLPHHATEVEVKVALDGSTDATSIPSLIVGVQFRPPVPTLSPGTLAAPPPTNDPAAMSCNPSVVHFDPAQSVVQWTVLENAAALPAGVTEAEVVRSHSVLGSGKSYPNVAFDHYLVANIIQDGPVISLILYFQRRHSEL